MRSPRSRLLLSGCPPVRWIGRRQQRVVGGQRAHRPRRGPRPLEPDRHPPEAAAPDPPCPVLLVPDILPWPPAVVGARGRFGRGGAEFRRLLALEHVVRR